jgi:sulfur-oxidizing protein SoxZ
MSNARIRMPATAKKGEVVEIKTLISHVMETGQRRDAENKVIARKIINKFTCSYNGKQVIQIDLHPAIAANPFLAFFVMASETGTLEFVWTDDDGTVTKETAKLTVA